MAQTKLGAIKAQAKSIGISTEEYIENMRALKKWCYLCREWHHINAFGKDATRGDGLVPVCRESRNKKMREKYTPKKRQRGRKFVTSRDDDKLQAYGRIHHLINMGLLEHPNNLPCVDCGHIYDGKMRHEYDHYLGYEASNHEVVEVVCSGCHHKRHPITRTRDRKGRFKNG